MDVIRQRLEQYTPDLGACWLLVILMFAGSLSAGLVLKDSTPQSLAYFLSMAVPFLFIILFGKSSTGPVPLNKPDFGRLGGGTAFCTCALAMICLIVIMDPSTSFIPMPDRIKAVFEETFINLPLWDSILSTCILAPIMEETLCRGVMMRGMLQHGSARRAIFWSAFIFAIMHANPWQSIPAFVIGIFFGWLYWRTGCLWLTIFLHCLNNSISTAMTSIMPEVEIDQCLLDVMGPSFWILFAAALIIFAALTYIVYEKTIPAQIHSDSQQESLGE